MKEHALGVGFHSSASTSPKVGHLNAAAQEECKPLINTYKNEFSKGRNNCTGRSGTFAIFVISPPLSVRGQR